MHTHIALGWFRGLGCIFDGLSLRLFFDLLIEEVLALHVEEPLLVVKQLLANEGFVILILQLLRCFSHFLVGCIDHDNEIVDAIRGARVTNERFISMRVGGFCQGLLKPACIGRRRPSQSDRETGKERVQWRWQFRSGDPVWIFLDSEYGVEVVLAADGGEDVAFVVV